MYELLVIPYDDVSEAEAAREQVVTLASRYLVYVADAVVATGDGRHHIRLQHLVDQWPPEPSDRPVWGTLAGLFQRHELVAASARSGFGSLETFGLDDAFMEQMATLLEVHAAALCVLARKTNSEHVIERLGRRCEDVLRTGLQRPVANESKGPRGVGLENRALA